MYYRKQFITTCLQLVILIVTNSLYEVALVTFTELFFNFLQSHITEIWWYMKSRAHTWTNRDTHQLARHCSHGTTEFYAAHDKQQCHQAAHVQTPLTEERTSLQGKPADVLDRRTLWWNHMRSSR